MFHCSSGYHDNCWLVINIQKIRKSGTYSYSNFNYTFSFSFLSYHCPGDIYIYFNMVIIKTAFRSIYLFWINTSLHSRIKYMFRWRGDKKGETPASCEQNKASNSRFQGNSRTPRIKPYWICWSFSLYFPTFSLHLHFSSTASSFRGLARAARSPFRWFCVISDKNSGWWGIKLRYLNFILIVSNLERGSDVISVFIFKTHNVF